MVVNADRVLSSTLYRSLIGGVCIATQAVAADVPTGQTSVQRYVLPAVQLVGADGVGRPLVRVLDDGRTTVMTFMYSSCATVCPIVNQTMVQFEQLLGADRARVNTVSITIDPTHDSVQKLADHAKRTGAAGSFYTGDPGATEAVQRAFNVWRGGDKMNHQPVFLLKAPGEPAWVRLDGIVTPQQLMTAYKRLLVARSTRAGL